MGAFYPQWAKRTRISIANPPTTTGYQVKVEVPWQPGMRDDFADIRFSDGLRALPYWIETSTTRTTATIWVKLTEINEAAREFYLYYGNGVAVGESNGEQVFDHFDHFLVATLDSSKWTTSGSYTVSNSVLSLGVSTLINSLNKFATNTTQYAIRARANFQDGTSASYDQFGFSQTSTTGRALFINWGTMYLTTLTDAGWGAGNLYTTGYHLFDLLWRPGASHNLLVDGSSVANPTETAGEDENLWIQSGSPNNNSLLVDWILVRKLQTTEPVCTLAESGVNPISLLLLSTIYYAQYEAPFSHPKSYDEWKYKIRIGVTNPPTTTGYQVMVTIPWMPGMSDDFADLRFSDYVRILPYWVESYTARSSALVWVKLTETGELAREFFCYYGNGSATSESNGVEVFLLFDDFLGSALNAQYWWIGSNNPTVSNSVASLTSGKILSGAVVPGWGTNTAARTRMKTGHNSPVSSGENIYFGSKSALWNNRIYFDTGAPGNAPGFQTAVSGSYQETGYISGWTVDTWHLVDILRNGATSVILKIDGTTKATHSTYVPQSTDSIIYCDSTGIGTSAFDWVLIRKYQATEPTCTPVEFSVNLMFYQSVMRLYERITALGVYPQTSDFYPGWLYKAQIEVANPPTITGYQVKVTIPWMPGMNDDFSDLRFSDYLRTLPYWIEDTATTNRVSAVVWVKLTETGEAAREFFLYYGNGGAASESSGDNTFLYFDHFLTQDTGKWNFTGTPTISNSRIYLATGGCTAFSSVSATLGATNTALIMYGKVGKSDATPRYSHWGYITGGKNIIKYTMSLAANQFRQVNFISSESVLEIGSLSDTDHRFELRRYGTTHTYSYIDNTYKGDNTSQLNGDSQAINAYLESTAATQEWDWIAYRIYNTETEPVCTIARYGVNWLPPRVFDAVAGGAIPTLVAIQHLTHIDLTWSLS